MSQIPVPIPTLPIASTTAAQNAHIASLNTQIEQLVHKNNKLVQSHEEELAEWEKKLVEERRRGDNAVRKIQEASKREVASWHDACETLRVASHHAMASMEYAHAVTKHDLLDLEHKMDALSTELKVKDMYLLRLKGAEEDLKDRLEYAERTYARRLEALVSELDETKQELINSRNKVVLNESQETSKLATKLKEAQKELDETRAALTKANAQITSLESVAERARLELKDEKRERKELEREMRELKDQVADWKRLETREAETAKEGKKRARELEVTLAAERSRLEELEQERVRWKKEKSQLQREKDELEQERDEAKKEAKAARKLLKEAKQEAAGKENAPEKVFDPKPKKRQREVEDASDDEGKTVKKSKPTVESNPKRAASPGPSKDAAKSKPKFKRPTKKQAEEEHDSDDTLSKRAKFISKSLAADNAEGRRVIKGALGDTSDEEPITKPKTKAKAKAAASRKDEGSEEVFDVDRIPEASDSDDEPPKPVGPKVKKTAKKKEDSEPSKPKAKETKQASAAPEPAKPKKRMLNLLGNTTGASAVTAWWGAKNTDNEFNIPTMLSSPEKGEVPRAKFGSGRGF